MPHELPKLPYSYDALEPHIDARTMEIHYTKHHQGYVTNLNAALEKHADLQGKPLNVLLASIKALPEDVRGAIRNNGGGHLNHSFFWPSMKKGGGGEPKGALADAIKASFGDFAKFKEQFTKAGMTRFGSGWAWLGVKDGKLCICSTPNQDNPVMKDVVDCPCSPILGVDVWEHAYYLKYQNRRKDYLDAWWNVVHWDEIAARFAKAK
ncbi:MAG TPA: superoxide dismutase [Verrucomicrobiae bacterium]|nr:superoxide dismutase [Verrucomicrobiae bacterium]